MGETVGDHKSYWLPGTYLEREPMTLDLFRIRFIFPRKKGEAYGGRRGAAQGKGDKVTRKPDGEGSHKHDDYSF